IGVILLLFDVGLETSIRDLTRVGVRALIVACTGVVVPFALGAAASSVLLPEPPAGIDASHVHLFLGATLAATSVGITARVLRDLNVLSSTESRVILGAAVIDDVLGLILLATISGVIAGGASGASGIATVAIVTTVKAVAFLGIVCAAGVWVLPAVF